MNPSTDPQVEVGILLGPTEKFHVKYQEQIQLNTPSIKSQISQVIISVSRDNEPIAILYITQNIYNQKVDSSSIVCEPGAQINQVLL